MIQHPELTWTDTSVQERVLSRDLARDILAITGSPYEVADLLLDLASVLSADRGRRQRHPNEALSLLTKRYPELKHIDVSAPFSHGDTGVSAGIFGQIGLEIGALSDSTAEQGVVATPSILAFDMVCLALAIWTSPQLGVPPVMLFKYAAGLETPVGNLGGELAELATRAVWYDPCVGTGIFPICIVLVLRNLIPSVQPETVYKIDACDNDHVSVRVAQIRMGFLLSSLTGQPFNDVMARIDGFVVEDNSLEHFSDHTTFDLIPNRIGQRQKDIVIGNPPYVRSERIPSATGRFLRSLYPELMQGKADMYNYFIAHGIHSLRNGGALCYVTPITFQRSKSGRATREYITRTCSVQAVFDFDELPVFQGISTSPSVYALLKGKQPTNVTVAVYDKLPDRHPLLWGLTHSHSVPHESCTKDGWTLSSAETPQILSILEQSGISLTNYAGRILSGIKTGLRDAYYLSPQEADHLMSTSEGRNRIHRLLLPKDIRAYTSNWQGSFILIIKKDELISPDSDVMRHLEKYRHKLEVRSDTLGHGTWYGLRECSYYSLFKQAKIAFPDIASECRFALDTDGYFIPDGAFFIATDDTYLLGLLNSCVGNFYFRARCSSIGSPVKKGRLRFKKAYVSSFPVPRVTKANEQLASSIREKAQRLCQDPSAATLRREIDELALDMYCIPLDKRDLFLR